MSWIEAGYASKARHTDIQVYLSQHNDIIARHVSHSRGATSSRGLLCSTAHTPLCCCLSLAWLSTTHWLSQRLTFMSLGAGSMEQIPWVLLQLVGKLKCIHFAHVQDTNTCVHDVPTECMTCIIIQNICSPFLQLVQKTILHMHMHYCILHKVSVGFKIFSTFI